MCGDKTGIRARAEPEPAARHACARQAPARTRSLAATTDVNGLQSGLFLPSELFVPIDPCLPPSLV